MILLKTKIYVPPLNPGIVDSQRLIQKLQNGIHGKLTLVSAPAGFGKTTVVRQWIDQHKLPVAWYSLDRDDNEGSVFYRYLLATLQRSDSSLKAAFDPLLQGQKLPVGKEILGQVVGQLSNSSRKLHLIFDDYHLIQSQAIHDDMFYLLQNTPPQLHVTVITRSDPPFPLARFRAKQEMTEIRTIDLRFNEEETAQFFKETMQLDLSREQLHDLHSRTEGWIVGLQIIGLSLQKSKDLSGLIANPSTENKHLFDYLLEEVLDNQSKEVQTFLLKTSILKQLHADLCREITGIDHAFDLLEQLERTNLFIIPLDNNREWYRYHSLFAEMLQLRLKYSEKESIEKLHKKAACWFAKRGYLEEAFQHAFNSGDLKFAADLLENNLMSLLANYEWAAGRRWLEKLPEEQLRHRFLLKLYHALFILLQEEFTYTDAIIADLEDGLDRETKRYPDEKRKYAQDLFLALKVNCLFYKDSVQVIPSAKTALQTISLKNRIALWLVQSVLSAAYIQQGDIEPAAGIVHSALTSFQHLDPKESAYVRIHLANRQADLERLHGRFASAEKLLKDAFESARREGITLRPGLAMFNITLAQIYYGQNKLKEALEHAAKCIEYTRPVSDIGYLLVGYQIEAFINQILGKSKLAEETMREALLIAHQTKSAIRIASTELAAVQLSLMRCDLDVVSKWATQRNLQVDEPFSHNFEEECLTLAQFNLAKRRYGEATDLLNALRPRAHERKRFYSTLKIDVILAAALYALGEHDGALRLMERCVAFSSQEEIVRPFVDCAAHIADLLDSLRKSKNGAVRIYAPKLLKICQLERFPEFIWQRSAVSKVESLSPRESEILRMISIGLTNEEIAEQAFVSLNTVKTHIRNIYGKLGVVDRQQAILRARELHFFDQLASS